ncbi:hypothetical protein [Shigella phage ESh31]|nr:hypothetical protein [Shigella phage ESh31]
MNSNFRESRGSPFFILKFFSQNGLQPKHTVVLYNYQLLIQNYGD